MYWPTATDRPMVIAQLTVSLVADEDLEEGAIKMMVFEIKINSKVNRQCDLLIQSYDFIKLARDRNMLKIMPIVEHLVFSSYTVFVLCWLLAVGTYANIEVTVVSVTTWEAHSSPRSLTHWGRDKMDVISQTTFSRAISSMKIVVFWLNFHWNMFARVQLTIMQHWFR